MSYLFSAVHGQSFTTSQNQSQKVWVVYGTQQLADLHIALLTQTSRLSAMPDNLL